MTNPLKNKDQTEITILEILLLTLSISSPFALYMMPSYNVYLDKLNKVLTHTNALISLGALGKTFYESSKKKPNKLAMSLSISSLVFFALSRFYFEKRFQVSLQNFNNVKRLQKDNPLHVIQAEKVQQMFPIEERESFLGKLQLGVRKWIDPSIKKQNRLQNPEQIVTQPNLLKYQLDSNKLNQKQIDFLENYTLNPNKRLVPLGFSNTTPENISLMFGELHRAMNKTKLYKQKEALFHFAQSSVETAPTSLITKFITDLKETLDEIRNKERPINDEMSFHDFTDDLRLWQENIEAAKLIAHADFINTILKKSLSSGAVSAFTFAGLLSYLVDDNNDKKNKKSS